MNDIVKMFSCCFLVKGYNRALIVDTQRKKYYAIPNALADFLQQVNGHSLREWAKGNIDKEDLPILDEYVDFLISNEMIFFCSSALEYERFPPMSTDWHYPAHISNAVVEIKTQQGIIKFNHFQKSFFIPYVQFIIRGSIDSLEELEGYIKLMHYRHMKGIQVLFDNAQDFAEQELIQLCNKYPFIETLDAFNSKYDKTLRSLKTFIVFTTQKEYSNTCCGAIGAKHFNPLLQHYTEAQQYNTCLNRKIAIDKDGNIGNCLSLKDRYGHIATTSIDDVVFSKDFQKYWRLKKDDISVCKDCEFRYICTDCRAYTEDPSDITSKPLKCGYDPYTSEWHEWSTHPMKQAAISYYNISPVTKNI
jgi:SPASM domain peptide maturase of grasp-with-spasm system